MRLLLDHHYSPLIAEQLRSQGHNVQTAHERAWSIEGDERLLSLCVEDERALLTNDVRDFMLVARRWALEDRQHFGLILTSDRSLPRSRHTIATYVTLLGSLMSANPDPTALIDQIRWLSGIGTGALPTSDPMPASPRPSTELPEPIRAEMQTSDVLDELRGDR